jgi:ubiquinone/menaquinone biosynthesis C-methylase UbiE
MDDLFNKDFPEFADSRAVGLVDSIQSGWFHGESDEFFSGFKVSSEDIVLDLGCGEGAASIFCAHRNAHIIIADNQQSLVDSLRERILKETQAGGLDCLVGDSDPIDLPDEHVTRVVCLEVLEHVETPQKLLSELVRVGKPEALYLLSVPGEAGEKIQLHTAPGSYFTEPNHIHIFSETQFRHMVECAGLVIETYSRTGFYWLLWMNFFWAIEAAKESNIEGYIRNPILPPFDKNLDQLAALWRKLIATPQGRAFKQQMDNLLPKNQVIVARKNR